MRSQSFPSLRVALVAGLATALLDFDWNLLETRPHELHPDLLLKPLLLILIVSWIAVGSGFWIGRRLTNERSGAVPSCWESVWVSFLLLWVLFFNLSGGRLTSSNLNSVLRLLAVTGFAAICSYVGGRLIGYIEGAQASNEGSTPATLEDLLLLLSAGLVLLVPFLLAEIILVEGVLSFGSLLATLLFLAASSGIIGTYLWRRPIFRRLAVGLVILLFLSLTVMGVRSSGLPKVNRRAQADPTSRPPVVLITIDTLRADALDSFGGQKGLTPNLDALADKSILFEHTFASSPWTMPSMASIMTGASVLLHQTPEQSPSLPHALPTLAEELQASGYLTLGIGRNAHLRESTGFSRGFDSYRFYPRTHLANSLGTQLLRAIHPAAIDNDATTTSLSRSATALIEKYSGETFFVWVHFFDPHIPYAPPAEFLPQTSDMDKFGTRFDKVTEVRSGRLFPSKEQREWIQALYEGEIRYVDHEIGLILATLDRLDLFDPALIVVTSDHGEEFWEHGGFEHGHSLNNKVIGVPLIVKPPRSPDSPRYTGLRIDPPVSIASVRATVLDVVGLPPNDSDLPLAQSLVPYWTASRPTETSDPIVSGAVRYFGQQLSVVRGPYKYVRHLEDGSEELYNLASDPSETKNLASSHSELVLELAGVLENEVERSRLVADELGIGQDSRQLRMDKETERELRSLGYID